MSKSDLSEKLLTTVKAIRELREALDEIEQMAANPHKSALHPKMLLTGIAMRARRALKESRDG